MLKKLLHSESFSLFALLAIALLIGILTLTQYGESWDEPTIYNYSDYAINAYHFLFHPQGLPNFPFDLNYYGPAYFMLANLLARFWMMVIPSCTIVNAWHLVYFLTFLAAALIVYLFAKRWMSQWAAFGVALLFLTQPLLWGHAFMNPKDTPFMTFFLASIYLGFCMVDAPAGSRRQIILILAAGLILGSTISIRAIGPLAGLFVLIYALAKNRLKAISFVLPYFLLAAVISFLTWPFLWKAPLVNYFASVHYMSQFPFTKNVLFWGQRYAADQLPRSFFPTILALQLTEPLLILSFAGVVIMVLSLRRKENLEAMILFLAWFFLPAIAIVISNSTLYDNARQLYFLFPPLFFAAGFALDFAFKYIKASPPRVAILLIMILPGIYPAIRLHPYEYVYYNSFVRGTGGAYRQFEMDYWGTSIQEAMGYLDANAPQEAGVYAFGPDPVVRQYARPDMQVLTSGDDPPQNSYDYAVILTRQNVDQRNCQKAKLVYTIGRRGATFAIVKELGLGEQCR
jgi:4-amino-4-deoxy-L-arabinose transferase-like glycosyltransferase